jgi:16S rRNA (cytosine967-C5)-methyltransferase
VSVSSPRSLALRILLASQRADRPLDELIERQASQITQSRDRALIMELVYGVLRRQEPIDWRLGAILSKPLHRLPSIVQMVLRLGAYQILFLDRIPPSAAVNQAVELAKASAKQLGRDWSGLVNGVLRNLIRMSAPSLPDPGTHPAEWLSLTYGIPGWLAVRWLDRMGMEQAESACRATSTVPGLTVRVNRCHLTREDFLKRLQEAGVEAHPAAISPLGVVVDEGPDVTSLPGFRNGDFYVEDEAAQLIPPILEPQPGDVILDACAAPGGKATHLAELLGDRGTIIAVDQSTSRLDLLRENCLRLQLQSIVSVVGDVRQPAQWSRLFSRDANPSDIPTSFDRILVDAPCSGLGVLRRNPESRWSRQPADVRALAALQTTILNHVVPLVRPGGHLLYSVCTFTEAETDAVVRQLLATHPAMALENLRALMPREWADLFSKDGCLRTLPHRHDGMDAFFAARFVKNPL